MMDSSLYDMFSVDDALYRKRFSQTACFAFRNADVYLTMMLSLSISWYESLVARKFYIVRERVQNIDRNSSMRNAHGMLNRSIKHENINSSKQKNPITSID